MPMVYYISSAHIEMGLWEVKESESFFKKALAQAEYPLEALQAIAHPEKKTQWLASRHLLTTLYPAAIQEYAGRKPVLRNGPHVSISHSGNVVGVLLGSERAGLDLQHPDEKLLRIAPRFVCEGELELLAAHNELESITVLWTIKEAVFKHYGTGLPFKQIKLTDYDAENGLSNVDVAHGSGKKSFALRTHLIHGVAVSFLCD